MLKRNDNGDAAAAFYDKRRKWMDLICEHPEVSDSCFRVGYWLARRMNGDDQCTWWPIKKIAKQTRCSQRTIHAATGNLERLGLMIVVRDPGLGNSYSIRLPFE